VTEYLKDLGLGFLLPGLICFDCLAGGARSGRPRLLPFLGILAMVPLAFFGACLELNTFAPTESWQRLPWLAAAACLLRALSPNNTINGILNTLFALGAAWLLVPDFQRLEAERPYWLGASALLLLLMLWSAGSWSTKLRGPGLPLLLFLATLAASLLAFFVSFAKLAQLGGIAAGCMAGCWLAAFFYRDQPLTSAIAPGWAVFFTGVVLGARLNTESEVPLASFALVVATPLTIWLTFLPGVRTMKPIWRLALGIALAAVPAALGLFLAGQVALANMEEW
jgi:hypothetical protein